MGLKEQIAYDNANVFANPNEFGQPVTYVQNSDGSGTTTQFLAVFSEDPEVITPDYDGKYRLRVADLGFSITGSGVTNPARNDEVTITRDDSTTEVWTVTRVKNIMSGWALLEMSRPEVLTKGNPYKERK